MMGSSLDSFVRDYRARCSDARTAPPLWTDTAVYAHGALDRCESLMRDARKHLAFSLRVTTAREPIRAMHHMPHAANWFSRATTEYALAVELMERTTLIMDMLPETVDIDAATRVIFDIGRRLAEIGEALALLSSRIDRRSKELLADARAAVAEGRPILLDDPVRPIPDRAFLLRNAEVTESLHALWKRRQRSSAAAPEDAPRKVSRGRAPPLLSDCAL